MNVPSTLLAKDGKLILHTNKSVLIHQTEKKIKDQLSTAMEFQKKNSFASSTANRSVRLIDEISVVNVINKTGEIKTFKEFSDKFCDLIYRIKQLVVTS